VTLGGAFSIPLALQDGSPFPERDLIIFIAAGVILLTLIIASITLPLFSKKEKEAEVEDPKVLEQAIKIKVLRVAIQGIREEMTEENAAALSVISDYNRKIRHLMGEEALQNREAKSRQFINNLEAGMLDYNEL
jgi:NhaP-type Na+/H+ or K+/H+ antiporter